jgi:hypothetical protein
LRYAAARMTPQFADKSPAFAERPHLQHDSIAIWLTHPAGIVIQALRPINITVEHANFVVGPAWDLFQKHFGERNGLTLVLDLEHMTKRTAASRSVFLAMARQRGQRFARGYVVLPRSISPAQLHGTTEAIALISAMGIHVEVVATCARAISSADLRVAPRARADLRV